MKRLTNLYLSNDSGWIHSAGNIDRIAPDIIQRLLGTDHSSDNGSDVDTNPDLEVVEAVLIDIVELFSDSQRVHSHGLHVHVVNGRGLISEARGCHVGGSGGLDLLDAAEAVLLQDLVEVCDDLIEQSETLHSLIVGLKLHVELGEVRNWCEDDASAVTLLVIQFLENYAC